MWEKCLLVGAGGFVGAITRYLVANLSARLLGVSFPYGTFIINVTGSFILGAFSTLALRLGWADGWRLVVAVGFVGAYTTFSTFEYETLRLLVDGRRYLAALTNVFGSVACGLLAAAAGVGIVGFLVSGKG